MALSKGSLDQIQAVREGRSTYIELYDSGLSKFPDEIRGLKGLEALVLMDCKIRVVPEWIRELPNLKFLDLRGDPVEQVTDVPGLMLDLRCYLTLQNQPSQQNIVGIEVDATAEEIPSEIRRFANLQYLIVGAGALRAVPDWLPELRNLTTLNLFRNRFSEIPAVLFQIPALERLDLQCPSDQKGQIKEVPRSILNAANLRELELGGHDIQTPPPEVVKDGVEAIKNYWRQRQQQGVDYLCEAKLIVVGEGGAGKTSLAQKIKDPSYQLKPSEPTTEGIEIIHWHFFAAIRTKDNDQILKRDFHVNTWDFGGQEIYHATHQFFLTRRSLYLLVADDRKEDTDFNYWLDVVGLLSDNSPLLIVQNPKQDRQRDINFGSLRARFANLRGDYRVNLADNRGLPELVAAIRNELESLPHIGATLPKTWRRVREQLEKDPREHITLDQYLAICQDHGFDRREDKLQLSGYLHDLGICLHFQDDAVLKNTVILRPKWGTDAVYRVLDDKNVFTNHGRFTDSDLARIWSEPEYALMRHELLRLMMKFQLCYELPGGGAYIAPQLLSSTQPAYEWEPKGNLVVRYQYDFMPKGLVSRLIVAQHRLIADQTLVWKSGVILSREGTRAEVIEDRQKNRIAVRASGPDTHGLIAIIDNERDRIHASFPSLPFEKYLPCSCQACLVAEEPFAYSLSELKDFAQSGDKIQCRKSRKMVDAKALVRDIFPAALRPQPWQLVAEPMLALMEVYVSYAWTEESAAIVDQLQKTLEGRGIHVLRDRNEVNYKDSIREFMESVGRGKAIVVILSKHYLESPNCMFELTEIADHKEIRERVFPIVLGDANIYDAVTRVGYIQHWEAKIEELDSAMKIVRGDNLQGIREDLDLYAKIRAAIAGITDTLRDVNTLTPEQHRGTDFEDLYRTLESRFAE